MKISDIAQFANMLLDSQGHKNYIECVADDAFVVVTDSTVYPSGRYKVNVNFNVTPPKIELIEQCPVEYISVQVKIEPTNSSFS